MIRNTDVLVSKLGTCATSATVSYSGFDGWNIVVIECLFTIPLKPEKNIPAPQIYRNKTMKTVIENV